VTPLRSLQTFAWGLLVVLAVTSVAGGALSRSIHATYVALGTRFTQALSAEASR